MDALPTMLRLILTSSLSIDQIAEACRCHPRRVRRYRGLAEGLDYTWPDLAPLSHRKMSRLFNSRNRPRKYVVPDFEQLCVALPHASWHSRWKAHTAACPGNASLSYSQFLRLRDVYRASGGARG